MKFTVAALSACVAAAAANVLPPAFTLVTDGGAQIETDGEYLYKALSASTSGTNLSLAIFHSSSSGAVTYTATNAGATAFQYLYILQDHVEPVGLTIPHSGSTPSGTTPADMNTTAFGVYTQDGVDYFAAKGRQGFAIAPDDATQEVYWVGLSNSKYRQTRLAIKECKGC